MQPGREAGSVLPVPLRAVLPPLPPWLCFQPENPPLRPLPTAAQLPAAPCLQAGCNAAKGAAVDLARQAAIALALSAGGMAAACVAGDIGCEPLQPTGQQVQAGPAAPRPTVLAASRPSQALLCYLGPPSHLFWNILPFTVWVLAVTLGVIFFGAQGGPVVCMRTGVMRVPADRLPRWGHKLPRPADGTAVGRASASELPRCPFPPPPPVRCRKVHWAGLGPWQRELPRIPQVGTYFGWVEGVGPCV